MTLYARYHRFCRDASATMILLVLGAVLTIGLLALLAAKYTSVYWQQVSRGYSAKQSHVWTLVQPNTVAWPSELSLATAFQRSPAVGVTTYLTRAVANVPPSHVEMRECAIPLSPDNSFVLIVAEPNDPSAAPSQYFLRISLGVLTRAKSGSLVPIRAQPNIYVEYYGRQAKDILVQSIDPALREVFVTYVATHSIPFELPLESPDGQPQILKGPPPRPVDSNGSRAGGVNEGAEGSKR